MAVADLTDWMDDQSVPRVLWYVKRLAANDTLASGAHQAGPYMPKEFLFDVFPSLNRPDAENPDKWFELRVDSHSDVRQVRAVWYNNKLRGKTRNEARLTNFGGGASALLDPDNTGALTVFAFHLDSSGEASACHAWVCDTGVEEDIIEERVGPVEPSKFKIWSAGEGALIPNLDKPIPSCWMDVSEIPSQWLSQFPSGAEIIAQTMLRRPEHGMTPDKRLVRRRECEYELFRSLEHAIELPVIQQGFATVDDFILRAQTILQRRKARSGRSLELHTRAIFLEEDLRDGVDFQHQPESEVGQRPDFLFPSQAAYQNGDFPANRLRMLAVKTTCKDRWRQILTEANRVQQKHLLTLQEGVSEGQFREMTGAGVQLVVPSPLFASYPEPIRPHLQTLESFIGDIRLLNVD